MRLPLRIDATLPPARAAPRTGRRAGRHAATNAAASSSATVTRARRGPAVGKALRLAAATMLAALLLAPLASAKYPYGSIVDKNDDDFTPAATVRRALLCHIDANGNGAADAPDGLYLAKRAGVAPCGAVAGKDLRLTPHAGLAAGTEVKSATEPDFGMPLALIGPGAHAVRLGDFEADGRVKRRDTVYLDVNQLAALRVDVGDVRLSAFGNLPAGSRVAPSDPDLNMGLVELPGTGCTAATESLESTNLVIEAGKGTYLNIDCDAAGSLVEEGDLRLNPDVPTWTNDLAPEPAKATVSELKARPTVAPGAPMAITARVANGSPFPGTPLFQLSVDDAVVDTRAGPFLGAGKAYDFATTVLAPSAPGVHVLRVGDATLAFNVAAPAAAPETLSPAQPAGTATSQLETQAVRADTLGPRSQLREAAAPGALALAGLAVALAWARRRGPGGSLPPADPASEAGARRGASPRRAAAVRTLPRPVGRDGTVEGQPAHPGAARRQDKP